MKNKLKISIALVVVGTGILGSLAFAQTNSNWNLPNIQNPDNLLNGLPSPISDFINSAKQIGDNVYTKSRNLNVNLVSPTRWFDDINSWFIGVTGISLAGIIKGVGNLIIWVLSLALDIVKWALSLIK